MRVPLFLLSLAVAATAGASLALAQASSGPTNVTIGFYRCSGADVGEVDDFVARIHGPIADALVAEGLWLDWSYLTHRYGDEYNRAFVYEAADLETHLTASAEFSRRLADRFDGVSPVTEHCPVHRDNIYTRTLP